jgi:lysophospholipase L1-like esterase
MMQQDADFITAGFLYMFQASCAHNQEYKILTRQPPVLVVMVAGDPHFAMLGTNDSNMAK